MSARQISVGASRLLAAGLLLVVAVVVVVVATTVCAAGGPAVDLKALCADKNVELTRRSQVRALVEQLTPSGGAAGEAEEEELAGAAAGALPERDSSGCSKRARVALVELDQLINNPDLTDVCSLVEVERIKEYYDKYIAQHLEGGQAEAAPEAAIPKALKSFVLAYGLKVSGVCKKNMISTLEYESDQLLKPADFEALNPWTDENSAISQIMNEPSDYDDLLLPRDLNRVLQESQGEGEVDDATTTAQDGAADGDKIFLQTATGHLIERTQTICERRFKPLYEQLILPLIYLSNLGFNYQGEDLAKEMKEMSVNKAVHQWYRIVYLCESLNGLEIVEDPRDSARTEGTDKRLVRILTREEAAALRAEERKARAEAGGADLELVAIQAIERIEFTAEYGNELEDQIVDLSDKNFMKLLNSFATHKSELDRIRAKLLKKMAKFLFERLKRGQFKFVGSLMGGAGAGGDKQAGGEAAAANDEMVKVFDEYVSQATSGEGAVAGVKRSANSVGGVAKRLYYQAAYNGASGVAQKVKKATIDKARVARYFYYAIAIALFIMGVVFLSAMG